MYGEYFDDQYVVNAFEPGPPDETYFHMTMNDIPDYIEEHEDSITQALEEEGEDLLVFKTVLEPGKDEGLD